MLFNSLAFLLFLPIVFALYWSLRSLRWQNRIIIAASFFFYGWWDWRFLLLMIATCVANYYIGNAIYKLGIRSEELGVSSEELGVSSETSNLRPQTSNREMELGVRRVRRHPGYAWLLTAILINIGLLALFKYFNFFADNLAALFSLLNIRADIPTLRLILPIGISFYTFQLTAYIVDIYRRQLQPAHDLEHFLSFIRFFPQLVAGPIERGANLLPQFSRKRRFIYNDAVDGMRLFLWGLMKKMLIADNCAPVADYVFGSYQSLGSADLLIGLLAFTVQVYCDFSGYSDMAIGAARLFGIRLSTNFNHPFFATTIREFWRRWHMTLMSWLRDYVYFPLGGSRCSTVRHYFNVFVLYMLSGLWHGPNWSFIAWGTWNGFFNVTTKKASQHMPQWISWLITVSVFVLSQIFFRNPTVGDGLHFFGRMFSMEGGWTTTASRMPLLYIVLLFTAEWLSRRHAHPFQFADRGIWRLQPVRYTIYIIMFLACLLFGGQQVQFIYFQF